MQNITRRSALKAVGAFGAAAMLPGAAARAANKPTQIGVVGKVKIPWFDNVAKGVAQAEKTSEWTRRRSTRQRTIPPSRFAPSKI